jgi:hypothetical protein
MFNQYYSKTFSNVTVKWCYTNKNDGINVQLFLGKITLEAKLIDIELNKYNKEVPFSLAANYHHSSYPKYLRGKFKLTKSESGKSRLNIDLQSDEIEITNYTLSPQNSDEPPIVPPINENEPPIVLPINENEPPIVLPINENEPPIVLPINENEPPRGEDGKYQDLFPFIYMYVWPEISKEDKQRRFIEYRDITVPECWYNKLVEIKKSGDSNARLQMEQLAADFLSGENFIQNIGILESPLKYFVYLHSWLRQQSEINLSLLKQEIIKIVKLSWSEVKAYINSDKYHNQKDKVWQNLFALTIILGFRPHLLDDIIKILVMCHFLERIFALEENEAGLSIDIDISQKILEAAKATIILPKEIFPLPPIVYPLLPPTSPPTSGDNLELEYKVSAWIKPYAIGSLKIVRQRLIRYELGEVAHIENVLKGELKKTTQRKLKRVQESVTNESGNLAEIVTDTHGTKADLLNETQKTIAKDAVTTNSNNLSTTYGTVSPPTATVTGGWIVEPHKETYEEGITEFAKEITMRTANKITQYISQARSLSTLDETEEIVVHEFDNRQSDNHLIGIYRWINKIYHAHLTDYGNRLIIEFMLLNPAQSYIKTELSLQGISLIKPTSPENNGISSYKDITRKNYSNLATKYDIEPPPEEFKIKSIIFQNGEPSNTKEVIIPDGYRAKNAAVTYILSGDNQIDLIGLVGQNLFSVPAVLNPPDSTLSQSYDSSSTGNLEQLWSCEPKPPVYSGAIQAGTQSFSMNYEDSIVPVAVTFTSEQSSPPSSPSASLNQYFVNIEIQCVLAEKKYTEWQNKIYNAIIQQYQKQEAEYYERSGIRQPGLGSRNPLSNRIVEKNELKQNCIKQLLEKHFQFVGNFVEDLAVTELSQLVINEPRYLQFFDQGFEWNEMTYNFYPPFKDHKHQEATLSALKYSDNDPLFTSFLQAGSARVLVPVRPEYNLSILYYLSTGMIWSGENALTPTTEQYLSIVNQLKILSEGRHQYHQEKHERKYENQSWEFTIPTSMIVVQDSSELPQFKTDID